MSDDLRNSSPIQRKRILVGSPEPTPLRRATAQIHTGRSGLTLAAQSEVAKLRIPAITSTDHLHEVFHDLQEISESFASEHDWYVNLSDLEDLPVLLAGALNAHRQDLQSRNREMVLEIEDLFHFRAALVAKLKKFFKIQKPRVGNPNFEKRVVS